MKKFPSLGFFSPMPWLTWLTNMRYAVWWNIHKIHQQSIHLFREIFNPSCWWNIHKVHQCSANLVKLQGICQINYYLPSKANTIVYIHLINLMEFKWLHSALIYHMLILNEVVNHISSNYISVAVYCTPNRVDICILKHFFEKLPWSSFVGVWWKPGRTSGAFA